MIASPPGALPILLACTSFQLGGTERNVVQVATSMDPTRFAVTVISLTGDGSLREHLETRSIQERRSSLGADPGRGSYPVWRSYLETRRELWE
jgi:hypothetical protein